MARCRQSSTSAAFEFDIFPLLKNCRNFVVKSQVKLLVAACESVRESGKSINNLISIASTRVTSMLPSQYFLFIAFSAILKADIKKCTGRTWRLKSFMLISFHNLFIFYLRQGTIVLTFTLGAVYLFISHN